MCPPPPPPKNSRSWLSLCLYGLQVVYDFGREVYTYYFKRDGDARQLMSKARRTEFPDGARTI